MKAGSTRMHLTRRAALVFAIVIVSSIARSTASAKSEAYHPKIDPGDFQATIDNPYYPLVPGSTRTLLEKSREGVKENEITVTRDTKVIMGVTCVVVHDVVRYKGAIQEETYEWFAQDKHGTVWYFGEDTRETGPNGRVSTEGSWVAGVGKAQPGIIMPGAPQVGQRYRQEYGPGAAEDMGQIVALRDSVAVPYGPFGDCIRTKEWSLLEPGTELKWYAKGMGLVRELSAEKEVSELVSVTP
jgi:hypothetical protein